ncbi:transporter C3602c protein [Rutstroemia sp. NJR-2017a BBW]|nr:transporter C3602c protein [Rutstroemia sp. NJR-2017a BBW]
MNSTPDSWYSAPEVVPEAGLQYIDKQDPTQSFPEVVPEVGLHYIDKQDPTPPFPDDGYGSKVHKNRICGLKARSFWILFSIITAVVVIGAVVGGGIGGSMAARSQKSKDSSSTTTGQPSNDTVTSASSSSASSSSASNTNNTPTPTSSKPITLTTTEVIGPSQTLFRDCPSSNGTLYDVTLGPRVYSFRKFCNTVLVATGPNVVGTPTNDLNTCINRCAEYNVQNNSTGWYMLGLFNSELIKWIPIRGTTHM